VNHKRKGPKRTRAGCLLCKPHKGAGNSRSREFGRFRDSRAPRSEEWNEDPGNVPRALCECCFDLGCPCCAPPLTDTRQA
jgi:hypothetical protein